MPMSVKERSAVERKAKKFWESLSSSDRFELGDQLVLGDLNWRDWLHAKPSPGFWNAVDALRMNWEIMSGSGGKKRHAGGVGKLATEVQGMLRK